MLKKLIEIAEGEVGIRESGQNIVKYNDWYWGEGYRTDGASYPWCVVFLAWAFEKAGVPFPHVAHCNQVESYAKSHEQWVTSGYRVGDAVIFDFNLDGNRDHIGLVVGVKDGSLETIEGNYSDMVARVKRKPETVVGAYRPDYKDSVSEESTVTEVTGDADGLPFLQEGDYGDAVGAVQILLRIKFGYGLSRSFVKRTNTPDCEFGPETASVLEHLTGKRYVDAEVWRRLIGGVG